MKYEKGTVALSLLMTAALSSAAQTSPATKRVHFVGGPQQTATMMGKPGSRRLSVMAGGNPSLGAGVPADCELRAREDGRGTWYLIPFESDFMKIDASDLRDVHFKLKMISSRAFSIATDYSQDNCGVGVSFDGTYRLK
jgi:hypothetical protein